MNQGGDWLSTPRPVSADPVGMAPHARRCGCYGTVLLCKLRRRGHSRPPSQAGGGRAEQSRAELMCDASRQRRGRKLEAREQRKQQESGGY
jgi:hypothetical protein